MKMLILRRWTVCLVALLLGALSVPACSDHEQPETTRRELGSVGLNLTAPAGAALGSVHYSLSGGDEAYSRDRTLDGPGNGASFGARIEGVPIHDGYTIAAEAYDLHRKCLCRGLARFKVIARRLTAIAMRLHCDDDGDDDDDDDESDEGDRGGNANNVCPVVQYATATPDDDGKAFQLAAVAEDEDHAPAPLELNWDATAGAVGDPTAADTILVCPPDPMGVQLTFKASDSACHDEVELAAVTCTGNITGAAGDDGAAGGGSGGTTDAPPDSTCVPAANQVASDTDSDAGIQH